MHVYVRESHILCEVSTHCSGQQRRELLCALKVEHRTDCLFTIRTYRMPYVAMAKTFEAIEATSGRLKIINTLSNLFRSILALTPDDLAKCVYLCLNNVRHVEVFLLRHYSIVCIIRMFVCMVYVCAYMDLCGVHMCMCIPLLQVGPAYEGLELGVGESLLIKAIAGTTGRTVQHIKADKLEKGDLGIVAEVCTLLCQVHCFVLGFVHSCT